MIRVAGLFAVIGALWSIAFPVVFAAMDPAYDPTRDFISELGAAGAPNASLVNWYGFLPTGAVMCCFAVLAWAVLPRSVATSVGMAGLFLFVVGYAGAAVFPCDAGCSQENPSFSQTMHNLTGLPGYLGAPAFMAALALAAWRWPGGAWLSPLAAAGVALTTYGLVGLFDESSGLNGRAQRILELGVLMWILACGCYLLTVSGRDRS
jgi:Protein of unknown function (DUF998)